MEIFTVKHLLHPKLTFMGTSEEGSTLNINEADTCCVCQRNLVGLIDLLGKLFVSSNHYLFNRHLKHSSVLAFAGLRVRRRVKR